MNEQRESTELDVISGLINRHESSSFLAINLAPSENALSPLARLPFVLDMYGRYFFDDIPKFGVHAFFGGLEPGEVETRLLVPMLQRMTGAAYINVKALSGLSCMTLALAALTSQGQRVMCIPPECGGHASTVPLGRRLGLDMDVMPMNGPYDVDLTALETILAQDPPALIYIDQSTQLFPIDVRPIRDLIDALGAATLVHYDASHVNGLVLGQAMFNPLDRGADTFGGSTHKTLPGPHKGFLATNDAALAERIDATAGVFISQHQPAAVVSLAITLLELQECGGREYASMIISNAQLLGSYLDEGGLHVPAADRGYTACHQVWIDPDTDDGALEITSRLEMSGLRINRFGALPGIPRPAFRLSVAELTRYGASQHEIKMLADTLVGIIGRGASVSKGRSAVQELRKRLDSVRYCFDVCDLPRTGLDDRLLDLVRLMEQPRFEKSLPGAGADHTPVGDQ